MGGQKILWLSSAAALSLAAKTPEQCKDFERQWLAAQGKTTSPSPKALSEQQPDAKSADAKGATAEGAAGNTEGDATGAAAEGTVTGAEGTSTGAAQTVNVKLGMDSRLFALTQYYAQMTANPDAKATPERQALIKFYLNSMTPAETQELIAEIAARAVKATTKALEAEQERDANAAFTALDEKYRTAARRKTEENKARLNMCKKAKGKEEATSAYERTWGTSREAAAKGATGFLETLGISKAAANIPQFAQEMLDILQEPEKPKRSLEDQEDRMFTAVEKATSKFCGFGNGENENGENKAEEEADSTKNAEAESTKTRKGSFLQTVEDERAKFLKDNADFPISECIEIADTPEMKENLQAFQNERGGCGWCSVILVVGVVAVVLVALGVVVCCCCASDVEGEE